MIPHTQWASIGSGSKHESAAHYAKRFADELFTSNIFKAEIHNPGGIAQAVARHISMDLERSPLSSVSNILQVGTVFPHEMKIQNFRYERHGEGWTFNQLVDLADDDGLLRGRQAYEAFAERRGLSASAAT